MTIWQVSPFTLIRIVKERDLPPFTYFLLVAVIVVQLFAATVMAVAGVFLVLMDFALGYTGGILVFQGPAEEVASFMFAVVATAMNLAVMYAMSRNLPLGETALQRYVVVSAAIVLGGLDTLFGLRGLGYYTGHPVTLEALVAFDPVAWFQATVVGGLDFFGEMLAAWLLLMGLHRFGLDDETLRREWRRALKSPGKQQGALPSERRVPTMGVGASRHQRQV